MLTHSRSLPLSLPIFLSLLITSCSLHSKASLPHLNTVNTLPPWGEFVNIVVSSVRLHAVIWSTDPGDPTGLRGLEAVCRAYENRCEHVWESNRPHPRWQGGERIVGVQAGPASTGVFPTFFNYSTTTTTLYSFCLRCQRLERFVRPALPHTIFGGGIQNGCQHGTWRFR